MKREEFLKQLEQKKKKRMRLRFTAVILKMRARKMRNPS